MRKTHSQDKLTTAEIITFAIWVGALALLPFAAIATLVAVILHL